MKATCPMSSDVQETSKAQAKSCADDSGNVGVE